MRNNRTVWLAAAATMVAASSALGQITGSEHDFSSQGWSGGEICKPCHTPHFANPDLDFRLWNHALTTATYELHGGTGTAADDFDLVSRLCLSCHDGTVALDAFGGMAGSATFIPASANLSRGDAGVNDLTDDHPVGNSEGIYYAYTDPDAPSFWMGAFNDVNSPTGSRPSVGPTGASLPLKKWDDGAGTIRNVVSCASCHEVHNRGGYDHLTRISNASSAMCLTCHIK